MTRGRESSGALRSGDRLALRLYVAGSTPKSLAALANLRMFCESSAPGRYEIEVIDLAEHPEQARRDDIVAIPTLVRPLPPPPRRMIGDLSDSARMSAVLQLAAVEAGDRT